MRLLLLELRATARFYPYFWKVTAATTLFWNFNVFTKYDFIQQTLNNIMYNVNVLVNYKFTGAYALQTKHEVKMTGYWPSSQ